MKFSLFLGSAGFNSGGPETYEKKLVQSLARTDSDNEYEIIGLNNRVESLIGVQQANFRYHTLKSKYRPVAMAVSLPIHLLRNKTNLLHATYIPPPISVSRYIYTLVCSTIFKHPEFYPLAIRLRLKALTELALKNASHILCISQSIADELLERYPLSKEQVSVVYLAADPIFKLQDKAHVQKTLTTQYQIDHPYFLVCGRWEKRKNIERILKAFHLYKKEHSSEIKLVFSGERKWQTQSADRLIGALGIDDDIVDLGKSPYSELPQLYAGAKALVFPSLWEGFGLPIVEAMSCGTPVITSNISSTAEVAADAALCVDPYSVEELAEAMYTITCDPGVANNLRQKGLSRASEFSWLTTAQQTKDVYQRLGNI